MKNLKKVRKERKHYEKMGFRFSHKINDLVILQKGYLKVYIKADGTVTKEYTKPTVI